MASLPLSTHLNPTRAAALVAGAATVTAAALVLWLVGSIIAAAGFIATVIVAAGAVIAWRMLAPARVAATPTIDWAFTRAVAQASTDAVAITDRAGRLGHLDHRHADPVLHAKRRIVERTIAWLNRNRRLAKDFETSLQSALAWLIIASVKMLSRRIARLGYS